MVKDDNKTGPEHSVTPMGQYYLLDKIAQGGMAEIYKGLAYDLHGLKKTVVIKKILPEIAADPEFINMLINEAKIAVMLSHGNIAQIYDLGKVGDDYFMVMEYVDGKSLSQIHKRNLKKGSLIPIEYACYFIAEVANGLNYMHRRSNEGGRNLGIVHRDISPQNVIVSYSGTVKIIDFGIAKAAIQLHITDSGVLKGKFAYMSPEQAAGEPIDHRTDIFSLGVILHELLTGKRLFKGKDKRETLRNVRRASISAPSEFRAGLPPEIDRIVLKALAKAPKNRYAWASDLHDDLIKYIYTNHPDFQPSSIVGYVHELFKDEITDKEESKEEAKTPFLIIDHTQSAILPENMETTNITRVPPQLSEFMLDDETPLPEKAADVETEKEKVPFNWRKFLKNHWQGIVTGAAGAILTVMAAFLIMINREIIKPPAFLLWLTPRTVLTIEVEPADAEITFGSVILKGKSKYKLKDITPQTNYRLIVEKEGYVPYFHSVALKKGEKKKLSITLDVEPPHYATINITSDPQGAVIYLEEKSTNLTTPATISELLPNKYYAIGLFLEGYSFWSRDITMKPDETKALHTKLAASFGGLQVISTPPGAEVYINGNPAGVTPFEMKELPPNTVLDVVVKKDGFTTWSEKVKIKPGKSVTIRPKLSRTKELMIPHFLRNLDKPPPVDESPPEAPESTEMLPPAPLH